MEDLQKPKLCSRSQTSILISTPPGESNDLHHVDHRSRTWDEEASVWVATSNDIEGLAVEADTMEELEPKVKAALADLIELNGTSSPLH
ncbi:DUF1902 domain-containing protein [Neorhizobium galegae]|uniref:DUF1902 domain-containing protein n=1 Tax=Neorhizobium galegae TaxID=399 RepID=UPI001FCC27AF|nr:DUF1902 domain-containing protein [Neorhizobium galegae]